MEHPFISEACKYCFESGQGSFQLVSPLLFRFHQSGDLTTGFKKHLSGKSCSTTTCRRLPCVICLRNGEEIRLTVSGSYGNQKKRVVEKYFSAHGITVQLPGWMSRYGIFCIHGGAQKKWWVPKSMGLGWPTGLLNYFDDSTKRSEPCRYLVFHPMNKSNNILVTSKIHNQQIDVFQVFHLSIYRRETWKKKQKKKDR